MRCIVHEYDTEQTGHEYEIHKNGHWGHNANALDPGTAVRRPWYVVGFLLLYSANNRFDIGMMLVEVITKEVEEEAVGRSAGVGWLMKHR